MQIVWWLKLEKEKGKNLRIRGGGCWGEEERWRRLGYLLLVVVLLLATLVLLLLLLLGGSLTTRRSTRTVVLWTVADEESSFTWIFIHLNLFLFPHRNNRSDDDVAPAGTCLIVSAELALNNNDDASCEGEARPFLSLAIWLLLFTLLMLLLLLCDSFSISFLEFKHLSSLLGKVNGVIFVITCLLFLWNFPTIYPHFTFKQSHSSVHLLWYGHDLPYHKTQKQNNNDGGNHVRWEHLLLSVADKKIDENQWDGEAERFSKSFPTPKQQFIFIIIQFQSNQVILFFFSISRGKERPHFWQGRQ